MKTDTHYSDIFATKDFWLAGALISSGLKLLRLDWESRRAYFIFCDSTRGAELAQAYWTGDLKVSAKAFSDALRTLKSRIYENEYGFNRRTP